MLDQEIPKIVEPGRGELVLWFDSTITPHERLPCSNKTLLT